MPVVLIPIHFDRDQLSRVPSCQRSIVLRPFCTQDFMTGVPAIPGKDLPLEVSKPWLYPRLIIYYSKAGYQFNEINIKNKAVYILNYMIFMKIFAIMSSSFFNFYKKDFIKTGLNILLNMYYLMSKALVPLRNKPKIL